MMHRTYKYRPADKGHSMAEDASAVSTLHVQHYVRVTCYKLPFTYRLGTVLSSFFSVVFLFFFLFFCSGRSYGSGHGGRKRNNNALSTYSDCTDAATTDGMTQNSQNRTMCARQRHTHKRMPATFPLNTHRTWDRSDQWKNAAHVCTSD